MDPTLHAYERGPWSLWHRHGIETPSASPSGQSDTLGFDYFRHLNTIDGDDHNIHLELFSSRSLTDERSRRVAFVTPLTFLLRFEGRW